MSTHAHMCVHTHPPKSYSHFIANKGFKRLLSTETGTKTGFSNSTICTLSIFSLYFILEIKDSVKNENSLQKCNTIIYVKYLNNGTKKVEHH